MKNRLKEIRMRDYMMSAIDFSKMLDVSFKKTSRDMKLYLAVTSREEKSDFV